MTKFEELHRLKDEMEKDDLLSLKKDSGKLVFGSGNTEATILFFHADWCPHCKKAQPEWNTFKSQYDGTTVNGYVIKCVDINCTNEKDSSVTASINEYKIESYPTVKMLKDNQVIEFDSKITNTSLNSFVETMLNQ